MITAFAMAVALLANQSTPGMGRVQLMRSLHTLAYVSPNICAGEDKIAVQIFNVSGGDRTNVTAVDFRDLDIMVIGIMDDGSVRADPKITLEGSLDHDMDSIRCVSSPSRASGAKEFTVRLIGGAYDIAE